MRMRCGAGLAQKRSSCEFPRCAHQKSCHNGVMRKRTIAALFALVLVPLISNAQTLSSSALQAQAAALLQQVNQLQAQYAASISGNAASGSAAGNSAACPAFSHALMLGSSGSDVSRLQAFLAQDPSIYPSGQVTGYFGRLTQAAVQRWQAQYGIVSSGTPASTGWGVVGPRTGAAIARQCVTGSASGSSGVGQGQTQNVAMGVAGQSASQPTVGGTMQVTPISGAAPLTVSVQTSLNTFSSCILASR